MNRILPVLVVVLFLLTSQVAIAAPPPPPSPEILSHQNVVQTALGKEPATLILRVDRVLDPLGLWLSYAPKATDIVIRGDRIAWVGPEGGWTGDYKAKDTKLVVKPGTSATGAFIETHIHVESSHLTGNRWAEVAVPRGTLLIFEASHESGNPLTQANNVVYWELPAQSGSPLDIFTQPPSAAPPTPFEKTPGGDSNGYEALRAIMCKDKQARTLDEVMNGPAWMKPGFYGYDFLWSLIQATWDCDGIVEGHGSRFYTLDLINAFASWAATDHELSQGPEALEKMRRGVRLTVRPQNYPPIIPYLLSAGVTDFSNFLLTTDDRSVEEIFKTGSMDYNIKEAIRNGLPVEKALLSASWYPAVAMHQERDYGAVIPGRFANIVLLSGDPREVKIHQVYAKGQLVAEDGKLTIKMPKLDYPTWATNTMNVGRAVTAADFAILAPAGQTTVTAAVLQPFFFEPNFMTATLKVANGVVQLDQAQNLEKFCMVDRYNKLPDPVACMFWKNVGPKTPDTAVAATESHDNHHIRVDSNSDEAAALAVNRLSEIGGGYVFVSGGKVIAEVPLPIAGLMSNEPPETVAKQFEAFWAAMEKYEWLGNGIPTLFRQKFATLTCSPWRWQIVPPFTEPFACPSGFVNVTTGECKPVVW